MSKFANAFSNLGGNKESQDSDFVKIDWEKVNKERVEIFKTQEKAVSRVGIVSSIIDLGVQELEKASKKSDIPLEEEAAYLEKNPTNSFDDVFNYKTKQKERHIFWPQKAQRCVAVTVDFPQFKYDWGGEIGEKPFRFLLNSEFIMKGMKRSDIIVARPFSLKETTKDFAPRWSLAKNSTLYKMAVATGIITKEEPFTKQQLGELIGKAALFEVRMWLNKEGYLEETISFKGDIPEGMNVPTYDESILSYVNIDGENDEEAVKQLRKSVKNTIKRSVSFEGSKLQEQFEKYFDSPKKENDIVEESVDEDEPDVEVESDSFDDSIPF